MSSSPARGAALILGLGLLAAPACGGKVAVESTSGAAGGVGGSGGAPLSTSSSSSTSASSSTGASPTGTPVHPCAVKCQAQENVGCVVPPDCVASCQEVFAAPNGCGAELAAYYECFADHAEAELDRCFIPPSCQSQFEAYIACGDAKCFTNQCGAQPDTDCNCDGFCGRHNVHAVCDDGACNCLVDSVVVGTCSDGSIPICGLKESCCTVLFPAD